MIYNLKKKKMIILYFLFLKRDNLPISAGSLIQLKNLNSWTYLSVLNSFEKKIDFYSTNGPLDESFYWTINTININDSYNIEPIYCESNITIFNTAYNFYLGLNNKNQFENYQNINENNIWTITCQSGKIWYQDLPIFLKNNKFNCYLSTSPFQYYKFNEKNKYPLYCNKNNLESIWIVEEGLFFGNSQLNH